MKVTMFAAPFGQGGQMHIHCRRYIRLLQLAGCAITLVEHSGFQSDPIPGVVQLRYPRRMRRLDGPLTGTVLSFLHKQRLGPLLRRAQSDLCHVQWLDERVLDVSRTGARPLIATAWGSDLNVPAQSPPEDPGRRRIGAALRELDLLIVDCDDIAATANQLAGTQIPTAMLPIGIDTKLFRPELPEERRQWRERLQIEPDAVVFLSARQLGAIYRPGEIIAAFAAMPASARERSYLLMRTFGHSVGTSLPSLQRATEELGVAARVRWVDSMAYELQPGLYVAADVAVNFPQMDAFPVTILESLACGVPVITNPLPAYQSNGVAPYLQFTREDSVPALSAAMTSAVNDLEGLHTQAAQGRKHVVRYFDERVSAARLKEIYEELLLRARQG
ncbi:glycosyltransferase family 4 protein [Steroidobacter sp. S1-65]|uniref:Glycosyltransferase family 4 protein n=1 Tax=Steroidobacter gossypii TaxID=2805490 RepID=A0ABS1WXG0_9GAMM|nr:glycosyltransferase family 4 protein [Steroidobacter gossypii]MBM0105667.1 glycosyltransferase family 4 protein [Steroidobacter gossypii]